MHLEQHGSTYANIDIGATVSFSLEVVIARIYNDVVLKHRTMVVQEIKNFDTQYAQLLLGNLYRYIE